MSTIFLQPRLPCVSGGTSRVCHWVVFLSAPLPHFSDFDGYFISFDKEPTAPTHAAVEGMRAGNIRPLNQLVVPFN